MMFARIGCLTVCSEFPPETNAEPRCVTSLVGHDGAICAAKHLELVHTHHLTNPHMDLTNSLRGTKY